MGGEAGVGTSTTVLWSLESKFYIEIRDGDVNMKFMGTNSLLWCLEIRSNDFDVLAYKHDEK